MSKESESSARSDEVLEDFGEELLAFLDRCIALGMTSLKDFRDVVRDDLLSSQIMVAAAHDPLQGRRIDVEMLEKELKDQALFVERVVHNLAVMKKRGKDDQGHP